MNMYAIVYNEYVKDLVIAHDEIEAVGVMIDFNRDTMTGVEPEVYDIFPIVKVYDTLQFMTGRGLVTVRELIDKHREPKYWLAIDNIAMQFN